VPEYVLVVTRPHQRLVDVDSRQRRAGGPYGTLNGNVYPFYTHWFKFIHIEYGCDALGT